MKTFEQYINEAKQDYIFGGQDNRNTDILDTPNSANDVSKWFDDNVGDDLETTVEFVFGNFVLYLDFDVQEFGTSKYYDYNGKTWYVNITQNDSYKDMDAHEMIRYDFGGENPKNIVCVCDDDKLWRDTYKRAYDPHKKLFKITNMELKDGNRVIVYIDEK